MIKYYTYILTIFMVITPFWGTSAGEDVLPIRYYQEIPYISGGIGKEERDALTRLAPQFNAKIVLALKGGDYVSDAAIRIYDNNKTLILDGVSEGPEFYTKLAKGEYSVEAIWDNRTKQGKLTIKETGTQVIHFYWDGE